MQGKTPITTKQRKAKEEDNLLIYYLSWTISFTGAVGKLLTYTFGTFVFFTIVMTGDIVASVSFLTWPHIIPALLFGSCVFFVSLAMEGHWLTQKIYDYLMGRKKITEPSPEERLEKAVKKAISMKQKAEIEQGIKKELARTDWASFLAIELIDVVLNALTVVVWIMAGAAKGMSAFAGTVGVFSFSHRVLFQGNALVLGFNPTTYWLVGFAAIFAASIAVICLGKEGMALYEWVVNFRRSVMARILGVQSQTDFEPQVREEMKKTFSDEILKEMIQDITMGGKNTAQIIEAVTRMNAKAPPENILLPANNSLLPQEPKVHPQQPLLQPLAPLQTPTSLLRQVEDPSINSDLPAALQEGAFSIN